MSEFKPVPINAVKMQRCQLNLPKFPGVCGRLEMLSKFLCPVYKEELKKSNSKYIINKDWERGQG